MNDELEGKHGVQSLEVGISILRAMAAGKRSMMLKDIALAADMPPSKAHRYLVSLIRTGLVEQDRLTSRYDLGPFALNLGLVALDRVDRIRLGLAAITDLRDVTNETIALAVWNDNGPVIVRWERPRKPITVNVLTGTNLRLLSSAAGRVFSAWLPEAQTEATLRQEIESGKAPADIRTRMCASKVSPSFPGITSPATWRPPRFRYSTSRTKSPWRSPSSASKTRWTLRPEAPLLPRCARPGAPFRFDSAPPSRPTLPRTPLPAPIEAWGVATPRPRHECAARACRLPLRR